MNTVFVVERADHTEWIVDSVHGTRRSAEIAAEQIAGPTTIEEMPCHS